MEILTPRPPDAAATSTPGPDWVVFDLETTGLSPAHDAIIQIAAVRMRAGRRVAAAPFFSYVHPGRPIPWFITQYTGIRDQDVRDAPGVEPVLREFSRFVGDATLIAHNGHRFDMRFLAACCERPGTGWRPVTYHDSLGLSWQLWGRRGLRHGLDAVSQRLGLSSLPLRRHDARGDVELLARAIELMCDRLGDRSEAAALRGYAGRMPCHSGSPTGSSGVRTGGTGGSDSIRSIL